jgi:hypothetical protein
LLLDMVAVVGGGGGRFEWMFCFAGGCTRGFDMYRDKPRSERSFLYHGRVEVTRWGRWAPHVKVNPDDVRAPPPSTPRCKTRTHSNHPAPPSDDSGAAVSPGCCCPD